MIRLFLLVFLTGCRGCSDDANTNAASDMDSGSVEIPPPNILLIDLAGLRSDRLNNPPPGIKSLQNQGVSFGHSIAPSGDSATSFTAMAWGQASPNSHRNDESPRWTLFNALRDHGYHTAVAWGNTTFNESEIQNIWLDPSSTHHDLGNIEGVNQALKSGIQEPFLVLLHDLELHRSVTTANAPDARTAHRIYNQSLMAYDAKLQTLLSTLDDTSLNERTIVVLTSNHGVELFDHGTLGHSSFLWDTVTSTPLIISDPDLPSASHGYVQSRPISTLDLAPTLIERIGLQGPNSMPGISLADALHTKPLPEREFFSWTPNTAASIRTTKWKLTLQPKGCSARDKRAHPPLQGRQCTLLYDLERDPEERESLTIGLPHVVEQMETKLMAWLTTIDTEADSTKMGKSPQEP